MELTKTRLDKILKKYRVKLEQLNESWSETCRRVSLGSTETHVALPTIYDHEKHNSRGAQLFKELMKEFDGYDVFVKKNERTQ